MPPDQTRALSDQNARGLVDRMLSRDPLVGPILDERDRYRSALRTARSALLAVANLGDGSELPNAWQRIARNGLDQSALDERQQP